MLNIITHPNSALRQKARNLLKEEIKTKKIQNLIDEMVETMIKKDGVGLAAPQVNESLRIIVARKNGETDTFINPEITSRSWRKETSGEGCLSIPGVYCEIKRSKKIKFKALDRNGKNIKLRAEGLFARIIQHETDHLDGILIINKRKQCEKPPKL